jgi:hypothetical protein
MSQAGESNGSARNNRNQPPSHSIFSVPTPIKQLFDQFPLLTYPINDLPLRTPRHRDAHVRYVFTTDQGLVHGAPSYNPACLKWQAGIHLISPTSHYSSSQHCRHTSSSLRYPSELLQRTTIHHRAAHYLSCCPRQNRISNHSQYRRASCNDGLLTTSRRKLKSLETCDTRHI